jgi:rhodanese-related sulfurtransferase
MKSPILALALAAALALPLAAQEPKPAKPKAPTEEKKLVPSKNVTVDEAEKLIKDTPGLIVLDVRSPEEFDHEHIKGAINANILGKEFESDIAKLDQTKPVLVHCAAGRRSSMALEELQAKTKFPQIYHMNDGFTAWKKAGKPFDEKPLPKPDRGLPGKPNPRPAAPPAEKPEEKK